MFMFPLLAADKDRKPVRTNTVNKATNNVVKIKRGTSLCETY